MKKLIIVIVVLLILVVGGYFLFNYISKPRLISSNSEPVTVCSDTDGNNIYDMGYSEYKYADGTSRGSQDSCKYSQRSKPRVGLIREGYCKDNQYKEEYWSCGWGYICRMGKCIKSDPSYPICSDGDGGIEPKVIGTVIAVDGGGMDSCWTSTNMNNPELDGGYGPDCKDSTGVKCYVYEYYCDTDGDTKQHKIIHCDNGCQNGVCL